MPEATQAPPPSRAVVMAIDVTPSTVFWTTVCASEQFARLSAGDDDWAVTLDIPDLDVAERLVQAATTLRDQIRQKQTASNSQSARPGLVAVRS
jgi:hypothetical protein